MKHNIDIIGNYTYIIYMNIDKYNILRSIVLVQLRTMSKAMVIIVK